MTLWLTVNGNMSQQYIIGYSTDEQSTWNFVDINKQNISRAVDNLLNLVSAQIAIF